MTASKTKTAAPKPSFRIETITPAIAERYLQKNTENRRTRHTVISRYAKDMAAGRWELTGDPITFNVDGTLVQGQHRLLACIESGASFTSQVMRNASRGAYRVMDTGEKRNLADLLQHQGEQYCMELAAAIHLLWRWDNGQVRGTLQPTRSEALDWLEENPGIRDCFTLPTHVSDFMSKSQSASLFYRFRQVDEDAAVAFFDQLASGEDLHRGDPILTLRTWFLNRKKEARTLGSTHTSYGRTPMLAVVVKAWNGYITGSQVQALRWRGNDESFPSIRDANGSPFPFPGGEDAKPKPKAKRKTASK